MDGGGKLNSLHKRHIVIGRENAVALAV
jgi:hypothetical protein